MDTSYFLDKFTHCAGQLDRSLLSLHKVDYKVGIWMQSVALKMQKKSWLNQLSTARPFEESIFFSIWINDEAILESKLHYNIHALHLRELKGYAIKSRDFAAAFRTRFQSYKYKWPNVDLNFGPLTLMEGWVNFDSRYFEKEVVQLASQSFELYPIIDELLLASEKAKK